MPLFHYQAVDSNGTLVSGDLEAYDAHSAIGDLHARGLNVQFISLATMAPSPAFNTNRAGTPPIPEPALRSDGGNVEQDVLRSHMAVILERGRAIAPALRAHAEEMPSGWQRRQLLSTCAILETGSPADAVSALAELPECWIPLLSAATSSPDPGQVLRDYLNESQRANDLRQKWWLTMVYPLIVLGLAVAVMTALSVVVIPDFRQIFNEFDITLPKFTQLTLSVSSFFATWGIPILAVLGMVLAGLVLKANRLLPTDFLSSWGDRMRLPFGRRTAIARFSRFLADLLDAGVTMPDSLRIAGFTVDQARIQQAAWQLATDWESTGGQTHRVNRRALSSSVALGLAPNMRPESRVRLLREISDNHAERIRIGTSWTVGLFEPLAVYAVGFVVGCTVIALFLPLISLVTALSG